MFIRGVKGVVGRWGIEMIKKRPVLLYRKSPYTETAGNEDPPGQISETITAKKRSSGEQFCFCSKSKFKVAIKLIKRATIAFSLFSSFLQPRSFFFSSPFSFVGVIFELIGLKKPAFWLFLTQVLAT